MANPKQLLRLGVYQLDVAEGVRQVVTRKKKRRKKELDRMEMW